MNIPRTTSMAVRLGENFSAAGLNYFSRLSELQGHLSDILGCKVDVIEEPVRKKRFQTEIDRSPLLRPGRGPAVASAHRKISPIGRPRYLSGFQPFAVDRFVPPGILCFLPSQPFRSCYYRRSFKGRGLY
jgi:hypothetical protein